MKKKEEDEKKENNLSNKDSADDKKDIPHKLDDLTLNSLYKTKIEEAFTNWKNELDSQVDKFNICGERLKNYELQFQSCLQISEPLAQLIDKVKEDSSSTLVELKKISSDEDDILSQLDELEKILIDLSKTQTKNQPNNQVNQNAKEEDIYQEMKEISKKMDEISQTIESINSNVTNNKKNSVEENVIDEFENEKKNMSIALNNLYNDLRSIQLTEQALLSKIYQVEKDLDIRHKEGIKQQIQ